MAEFSKVAGLLRGLWNGAMAEAEVRARRSGEAAGVERVLQALEVLNNEWRLDRPELVTELRRRLEVPEPVITMPKGVPLDLMTAKEWEEAALESGWRAPAAEAPVPIPLGRGADGASPIREAQLEKERHSRREGG